MSHPARADVFGKYIHFFASFGDKEKSAFNIVYWIVDIYMSVCILVSLSQTLYIYTHTQTHTHIYIYNKLAKIPVLNKIVIVPNSRNVSITIWLHHWDFYSLVEEKAWWEKHNDDACYFEQNPEAAQNKITSVLLLIFDLTIHPSKTNKTCWTFLVK